MDNHGTRPTRVTDVLLYCAIAIALVVSIALFAFHQARTGGSPNLPLKWLGFLGTTAIVFGYAIRACRASWRRRRFWGLLAIFLCAHFGLGVVVLMRVANVPLLLFAVVGTMEYLVLATYLDRFLGDRK